MIDPTVGAALVSSIPATVAAIAAWKAQRNSKPISNGFTGHVLSELDEIKKMLHKHVNDKSAHLR